MVIDNTHSADCLNPRQQRFVELYTSGMPAGRAYEEAGYASRGGTADADASKMVRNPKVSRAIQKGREENRQLTSLSSQEKMAILARIAMDAKASARDRISAIKVHNEMTGDNSPRQVEVSHSQPRLASIRTRAAEVSAALARRYL